MKINELHKPKEINQLRDIWNDNYENAKDSKEGNYDSYHKAIASYNTRNDIIQLLGKYGFTLTGEGFYGQVFINPNHDYALKVFRKDTGFMNWLNFCRKHQNNPYIPKIKGKIIRITPNIFAIRIEKLEEANFSEIDNFTTVLTQMIENEKEVPPILKDIIEFFRTVSSTLDINNFENFMERPSDGHIVITDPVAG